MSDRQLFVATRANQPALLPVTLIATFVNEVRLSVNETYPETSHT